MTVYYELDHGMKIPLVPIVQNCAVPPLVPVRRAYEFGKALGDAIRSYTGLQRVAVIGAGGLSHWIGNRGSATSPRTSTGSSSASSGASSTRCSTSRTTNSNSPATARTRSAAGWPVAGAVDPVRPRTLAYEPVYPWITGMAVAEWETAGPRPDLRNRGGAGHPTRGVTT